MLHGRVSRFDRLLEEGDPRFLPEASTEQHRGVGCSCQNRTGVSLRRVVGSRKLVRSNLQVDLETGVAGFEHDRVIASVGINLPLTGPWTKP